MLTNQQMVCIINVRKQEGVVLYGKAKGYNLFLNLVTTNRTFFYRTKHKA